MDAENILQALKDGNVPAAGISEICVGRDREIKEFEKLLEKVQDGAAITKFINGEYGAGKSFFLKTIEEIAYKKNFVVSKITLTREVPFNKFEVVYRRIVSSLKCKTGVSLEHIIERWLTRLKMLAIREDPENMNEIIIENMDQDLSEARRHSPTFALAVENYYKLLAKGEEKIAKYAMGWLSGDKNIPFTIKKQFGVKGDIDRENAFDFLEAISIFLKSIKYSGLVILVDEAENIMLLHTKKLRDIAYDYIRYIYDECNQRGFESTLFIFAGTPEFFEDQYRGVPSYTALHERIEDVIKTDLPDYRKPIVELNGFSRKELSQLAQKLFKMHKNVYDWDGKIIEDCIDDIIAIHEENSELTGTVTPRIFVRSFISVMDIAQQNPNEVKTKRDVLQLFEEKETEFGEEEEW